MRSALLCCCILVCTITHLHAQETFRPLQRSAGNQQTFLLNNQANNSLRTKSGQVLLELPGFNGQNILATVERKQEFSPNYRITTSDGKLASFEQPACYLGKIKGQAGSSVLVLTKENYFYAVIFKNDRAYVLVQKPQTETHVAEELRVTADDIVNCGTTGNPAAAKLLQKFDPSLEDGGLYHQLKCTGVYFELGYDVYTSFQSNDANVLNYLNQMFGVVSLLFAREGIPVKISETFIWHTPDPYQGLSYIDALVLFTQNRPVVNGQFGHLMKLPGSVTGGIDGVAWLNFSETVFCSNPVQRAYSHLRPGINPFPQLSATVKTVAHELGHNFGSPHTHYCYWQEGPMDNCATPEPANCPLPPNPMPSSGGTIMSYCPATNFINGFGQYPGNLLRRSYLALPDSCKYDCTVDVSGTVCPSPGKLELADLGNYSYQARWDNPGVDSFYVELLARNVSDPAASWQLVAWLRTTADIATFNNLLACTEYAVRVQSFCGLRTGYFISETFSIPLSPDNCVAAGTALTNYIQALKVNDKENVSGNNNGLLSTCYTFHITEGGDNYFKFTPGVANNGNVYYWRVWLDLDRNNVYDSINELMYTSPPTTQVRKAAVYVPPPGIVNPGGPFKMRVTMKNGAPPSLCETGFDGEVENYIINNDNYTPTPDYCFSEGNSDASAWISNVTINGYLANVNNSTAQSGGYASYDFGSKYKADSTYTFSFTSKRLFSFTRLYTHAWIDFNGNGVFEPAESIFDQSVVPNQAYTGSFTVPSVVRGYRTRLRVITSTLPVSSPCGIHETGETEDYILSLKGSGEADGDQIVERRLTGGGSMLLYPNPATGGSFYWTMPVQEQGTALLTLTDVSGKQVFARSYQLPANATAQRITLPQAVKTGMYFVKVEINGRTYHQKLVLK